MTNTGGLVEVLTDGKGGTWTIIVTTPQGMSCLVAAGEGWRSMQQVPPFPRVLPWPVTKIIPCNINNLNIFSEPPNWSPPKCLE